MSKHLDAVEFLESVDAIIRFAAGKKIAIEVTRPDGLRVQASVVKVAQ